MKQAGGHPVLVLCPGFTDMVRDAGFRVVSRDPTRDAAAQFRDEPAAIVITDIAEPLEALAAAVEIGGGALVVVAGDARAALAAGATHHLPVAAGAVELAVVLGYAERHMARVAAADRRTLPGWADLRVQAEMTAARLAGADMVVVVALSRLDLANAAHGRAAVDRVLEEAEARIGRALGGARIARLDGARFAVATRGMVAETGAAIAAALAAPFDLEDRAVSVGSRLGVAQWEAEDDAARVLRRAFDAVGGGRAADMAGLKLAAPGVPVDALAIDIHRAIERAEIGLLFQPQVDLSTGAIVGVEALARWEHPRHGSLGAEALFAAIDRADLGLALSDHIQELALRQAAGWAAPLDRLRLSVNVTAADVARPAFGRTFLDRVRASGLAADRLTVEITETGLIEDLAAAARLLDELRAAGCRVAIDDFGTGYSSLAYLTALPLDYLKLDKALTRGIDGHARERVVVRGTIAMAKQLGLAVIAEGVETRAQRYQLAALGCDLYQGFLCAGPLEASAVSRLMEDGECVR